MGKKIIAEAIQLYRLKNYKKMIVGTANSSIANIAFYQKAGFRLTEIKKGFFDKYPVAIYEDGIRAQDMIMFEKYLD
ncbi:acetyltransferase [Halalkalibacter akibai JCM 9157]|uniref:Acetyltransferase n=1 Tax=Halalkalibacter akibai (strain ATCC 43226 / DSM 21942 / CIP 109018 / JCM 9157 / 1139) TaxID=1236973 RepID=W4QZG1_HALA3|nr:acetyltransferase [Halalkalibacter akibai JCM 9157]